MEINSILDSIKDLLGVDIEDTSFDPSLIMHINGALMIMHQLGVGPRGYKITSKADLWSELLLDRDDLEAVKSDVYLRVRLIFDPPQNSFLVNAINAQIQEYDWRITTEHIVPAPVAEEVDPDV